MPGQNSWKNTLMINFRRGSFGIVIDDYTFSTAEWVIEKYTGDGHHVFCYHGEGVISEALVKEGVVWGKIDKYFDGKSCVLMCVPSPNYFSDEILSVVCSRWADDIGKKYDKLNILGKMFRRCSIFNLKEMRICSEHLAYGYKDIYSFLGKSVEDVSPNDILRDIIYCKNNRFHSDVLQRFGDGGQSN